MENERNVPISTGRLAVYRILYRLNMQFERVHETLTEILTGQFSFPEQSKFALVPLSDAAESWKNRIGEIQAEANKRLTGMMNEYETKLCHALGEANEEEEARMAAPAKKRNRK